MRKSCRSIPFPASNCHFRGRWAPTIKVPILLWKSIYPEDAYSGSSTSTFSFVVFFVLFRSFFPCGRSKGSWLIVPGYWFCSWCPKVAVGRWWRYFWCWWYQSFFFWVVSKPQIMALVVIWIWRGSLRCCLFASCPSISARWSACISSFEVFALIACITLWSLWRGRTNYSLLAENY